MVLCTYIIIYKMQIQKFVFINYSNSNCISLQPFHGKAIALDIKDHHAPLPSLFIIHEMRVRGFNPFQTVTPNVPDDIAWQDWILTNGIFDNVSGSFHHDGPPVNSNNHGSKQLQLQFQPTTTSSNDMPFGTHPLELNDKVISDILAATYAMPSWKACQIENTSWTGTAEENRQKYLSIMQAP